MYSTAYEESCQLSTPVCLYRILGRRLLGAKTPYRNRAGRPACDCWSIGATAR